jgi:hypothetical protein
VVRVLAQGLQLVRDVVIDDALGVEEEIEHNSPQLASSGHLLEHVL